MKRTTTILSKNRRPLLTIAVMMFITLSAKAQTWNEWFHQNKTQKKYLLAQIAALQIYIDKIKEGFSICQQGLGLIHQIKNGEFNLHSLFYTSLKQVNPNILQYAHVADIIANHAYILNNYRKLLASAKACKQFTPDELAMFSTSLINLMNETTQTLDDLIRVTTNNKLQMTDDERLSRIETLYKQSVVQRDDLHHMEIDLRSMALIRQKGFSELRGLSDLYATP